jgi:hypothetical protein
MDHSSRIKVLKQLARTRGASADKALEKETTSIAKQLETETQFDILDQQLELLDSIAFRVAEKSVSILREFIKRLETLELTHSEQAALAGETFIEYESTSRLSASALNILDRIRYFRPIEILEIFVESLASHSELISNAARQGLRHLAEYNIDIFCKVADRPGLGPAPQLAIVDWLDSLDDAELVRNTEAAIELCGYLLSPTMEGTSWDYQTVTWSTASVPPLEPIREIRRRSLDRLQDLYTLVSTPKEKRSVLSAMLSATRVPQESGDKLRDVVSRDTVRVLQFFKRLLPQESLQLIEKIEHHSFWLFYHAPGEEVKSAALEIRDILDLDQEYKIYKELIGFEGIFEDWQNRLEEGPDFSAIESHRSAKALEYAEDINSENWDEWHSRIIRFAETESNDLATFPHFHKFLEHFAKASPQLAFGFLQENLDEMRPFIIPMLRGLWDGPLEDTLRVWIENQIAADQNLFAIAKLFYSNNHLDEKILAKLLEKAIANEDSSLLIALVSVAASNYSEANKAIIDKLFLPAVVALTELGNSNWIFDIWYRRERAQLIHGLSEEGRDILLRSLLLAKEIDYQAEELLIPLASENPERIINFFGERVSLERERKVKGRYEAIPFTFHKLQIPLAEHPAVAVDTVRGWFDDNDGFFEYRGARLLRNIFSAFPAAFEKRLLTLVESGHREDIAFVLSILGNYEGQTFLHRVCREIVARLPQGDELLTRVYIALQATGVVTGEFGFAEAYERKISEIESWLSDGNASVRAFAEDYVESLTNSIERERRRAEESIALRKHALGVREPSDKAAKG